MDFFLRVSQRTLQFKTGLQLLKRTPFTQRSLLARWYGQSNRWRKVIGVQMKPVHQPVIIHFGRSSGSGMHVLSPQKCDIEILEHEKTVNEFRDQKIKELDSKDSEEPFYVANLDILFQRHLKWLNNLPRVKPFYAVKCNNTPAVLKMLSALGTGFDCASKAEIQLALSLGVTPDKIIYAHTTKPLSHIKYACTQGVNVMTFDNEEELQKISCCHAKAKLVLRIAVDDSKSLFELSSKFGARLETVGTLLKRAGELGLEVIGVSFHVGSGCTESLAFRQAIADARHVFDMAKSLGFKMHLLDIGGGFPGTDDFQVKFEELSEVINGALDEFFPPDTGVQIIAEPGRYYVESAFTLAANVFGKRVVMEDTKEHCGGEENGPNGTIMYYLNDGIYGSLSCVVNADAILEPCPQRAVDCSEQRYRSVFWGPTCDSLDKVTNNCWIPELHVGDWLLFNNRGAYSVTLCTDFNGFERAQVYSVLTAETWHKLDANTPKLSDT